MLVHINLSMLYQMVLWYIWGRMKLVSYGGLKTLPSSTKVPIRAI